MKPEYLRALHSYCENSDRIVKGIAKVKPSIDKIIKNDFAPQTYDIVNIAQQVSLLLKLQSNQTETLHCLCKAVLELDNKKPESGMDIFNSMFPSRGK